MIPIRASIEDNLAASDLTAERIARLNYVSTSYLHKVFNRHEGWT